MELTWLCFLTLLVTVEQLVLPVCFTDMCLDAAPQIFPSLFRLLKSQCVKHVNRHQPIVAPYAVHSAVLPLTRAAFSHEQRQCGSLSWIHAFLQCIASRHSRVIFQSGGKAPSIDRKASCDSKFQLLRVLLLFFYYSPPLLQFEWHFLICF